jgi:hypothetical protein
MDYPALKLFVANMIAPGSDTLAHVHGGMAMLLVARLVTRRSLATPLPLACVFALQILNECIDRYVHGSWRLPDTLGDSLNTVLWPTVLFLGLRWRRSKSGLARDEPLPA